MVVCGAQKALVQALLKERTPVIPVPIVDKNIDSVGDCGVDLHFHYARVGFVYGSPQRLAVPDVFRRLERGVLRRTQHGLPLTHSLRPENRRTALTTCVSRPYVGGYIVLHSIFPPFFFVDTRCMRLRQGFTGTAGKVPFPQQTPCRPRSTWRAVHPAAFRHAGHARRWRDQCASVPR